MRDDEFNIVLCKIKFVTLHWNYGIYQMTVTTFRQTYNQSIRTVSQSNQTINNVGAMAQPGSDIGEGTAIEHSLTSPPFLLFPPFTFFSFPPSFASLSYFSCVGTRDLQTYKVLRTPRKPEIKLRNAASSEALKRWIKKLWPQMCIIKSDTNLLISYFW